jgi:hypothetical protein
MSHVNSKLLAAFFVCAILIGFVIGDADLSLAVTVLVGFATIAVLVVAALALELHFRGPRGRVHLSRG